MSYGQKWVKIVFFDDENPQKNVFNEFWNILKFSTFLTPRSSESGHSSRSQDFVLHFFYSQDFEPVRILNEIGQDFELAQIPDRFKILTGYKVAFRGR